MTRVMTIVSLLAMVTALASCGPGDAPGGPPPATGKAADQAAPTLDEAASATYSGLYFGDVTLDDGAWKDAGGEGSPGRVVLAEGFRVTGNLDDDPADEAVVIVATSTGGSGTFQYLAVLDRRDDGSVRAAATELGDRVQVRSAGIQDRQLGVDVVRAGPDDALCCPGENARLTFAHRGGALVRTSDDVTGRTSLEDLTGIEWPLIELAGEPVPDQPAITLEYREGSLAGVGGCNRYTAAVKADDQPEAIRVTRIVATRMSCPGDVDLREHRYLTALEGARSYAFNAGRLVLSYVSGDRFESMTFAAPDMDRGNPSPAAAPGGHHPN